MYLCNVQEKLFLYTIFHLTEFICKPKFKAQRCSGVAIGYPAPWGKKYSYAPSQQKLQVEKIGTKCGRSKCRTFIEVILLFF